MPKTTVEAYPADIRSFVDNFRPVSGAVLVQYTGRERTPMARTRGTQVVSIEISAISKNLREHTGVYPLLDGAFAAVSGKDLTELVNGNEQIIGVTLYQKSESYHSYLEKNGLWIYTQAYESIPFPYVQDEEEEEEEQLITQIQIQVNGNIETTIPELG